jgi:hypothetical protein
MLLLSVRLSCSSFLASTTARAAKESGGPVLERVVIVHDTDAVASIHGNRFEVFILQVDIFLLDVA